MNEREANRAGFEATRLKPVVVSRPGAAIRVHKMEITGRLKEALTTRLRTLEPRARGRAA